MQVWNVSNGKKVLTFSIPRLFGLGSSMGWSPNGWVIAVEDEDGVVSGWDASKGNKLFTFNTHTDLGGAIAWSPNNEYLVTGGFEKNSNYNLVVSPV